MIKYYFVVETVVDRNSGESVNQTWIFQSTYSVPQTAWLEESLQADPSGKPILVQKMAYSNVNQTFVILKIKELTLCEYNFLKEIGVQVMK